MCRRAQIGSVSDQLSSAPTMTELNTLAEIILEAKRRLAPEVWDFIVGGGESETTVRRNRAALDALALRPEVLRDVSRVETATTLLGHPLRFPVVLAPMGSVGMIDDEGALGPTSVAGELGLLTFMSGIADPGPAQVMAAATCPVIFTLIVQDGREWLDATLDEVCALGFNAITLLADNAYYARRDRDLINKTRSKVVREKTYSEIQAMAKSGVETQPLHSAKMTWETLEYVKKRTGLALVLKGVTTGEDAKRAIEHGVDAVYVSNTGGRQLDHQPGTVDVLPEVLDAVAGKVDVMIDGGIMRGADVIKALALGAKAVGVGRLQALALGAAGKTGLHRALSILQEELLINMALLGVTRIDELSSRHIRQMTSLNSTHPLSPFPVVMERLSLT